MKILFYLFFFIMVSCSSSPENPYAENRNKDRVTKKQKQFEKYINSPDYKESRAQRKPKTPNDNSKHPEISNINLLEYQNQSWEISFSLHNKGVFPLAEIQVYYGVTDKGTTFTHNTKTLNVLLPPDGFDHKTITFNPPPQYEEKVGFAPFVKLINATPGKIVEEENNNKQTSTDISLAKNNNFRLAVAGEIWQINDGSISVIKSKTIPQNQNHLLLLLVTVLDSGERVMVLESSGWLSPWKKVYALHDDGRPYATGWILAEMVKNAQLLSDSPGGLTRK